MMTAAQLQKVYEEADADLTARTRALTAESVARLMATIDAVFTDYMDRPRDVNEDGFGRPLRIERGD